MNREQYKTAVYALMLRDSEDIFLEILLVCGARQWDHRAEWHRDFENYMVERYEWKRGTPQLHEAGRIAGLWTEIKAEANAHEY